jgi:hypothetical protein
MMQPPGTVMQIAYVVEDDLDAAAIRWVELMRAGPFFVLPHLELIESRYRGEPGGQDVSIALGYSGGVCVELVQQHNDAPSVFRELLGRSGPGFHHWALMTERFDEDRQRHLAAGHAEAFSGAVALGARFAYIDTVQALGGMIELIELTPPVRELFGTIEQAAQNWDGSAPLRSFG